MLLSYPNWPQRVKSCLCVSVGANMIVVVIVFTTKHSYNLLLHVCTSVGKFKVFCMKLLEY